MSTFTNEQGVRFVATDETTERLLMTRYRRFFEAFSFRTPGLTRMPLTVNVRHAPGAASGGMRFVLEPDDDAEADIDIDFRRLRAASTHGMFSVSWFNRKRDSRDGALVVSDDAQFRLYHTRAH